MWYHMNGIGIGTLTVYLQWVGSKMLKDWITVQLIFFFNCLSLEIRLTVLKRDDLLVPLLSFFLKKTIFRRKNWISLIHLSPAILVNLKSFFRGIDGASEVLERKTGSQENIWKKWEVTVPARFVPATSYRFCKLEQRSFFLGREPWSSGYGRRLSFWRSWVRISVLYTGWIFIHINLL